MRKVYTSIILLIAMLFGAMSIAQEQQKSYINYQGVARKADGTLMGGEPLTIGIGLKFGSASSETLYEETHNLTADANGVFSLLVGNGNSISGDYNDLPWGSFATFASVSMNGSQIGITELMAVPHALSSADNQWHTMGDDIENKNGGNVFVTGSLYASKDLSLAEGAAVNEFSTDITLGSNSDEIVPTQKAIKTYVDSQLGGSGGGADDQTAAEVAYDNSTSGLTASTAQDAIDELVTSGAVDADSDPNNEIQALSFDIVTSELSLTDGGSVILPSGGTDADADPNNEIQDISLSGTELTISDGSTIDLAPIIPPGGTDDQNAGEVPYDNTASGLAATDSQAAIDELASGGLVDTDDQALILTGDVLTIEDGAGSVDLSAYKDDLDKTSKTGILIGDGASVTGLIGTADGQVAKWNAGTSSWEAGTDDTGGGGGSSTGLEAIDEGNGTGWRLIGRDPNDYGNIGENAVDLSHSNDGITTNGATGDYAVAMGESTKASGNWSIAMGRETSADGQASLSMGFQTSALGDYSVTFGRETIASGILAVAMNSETSATNDAATSMGFATRANGRASVSMGVETKADAYSALAMGRYNIGGGHPTNWLATDPIFEVGIGSGNLSRTNALTILKNGNIGIGNAAPTARLEVDGNIRSSDLVGVGERNVVADASGNLIIGAGGGGSSPWTENGSNIHFNGGNVGIGTNNPSAPLEIRTANGRPLLIESTSNNSYMQYATPSGKIGYSGVWSNDNDVDFGTTVSNNIGKVHLTTKATPKLTVTANGNVGIGGTSPTAKLHIFQSGQALDSGLRFSDGINEDWTVRHGFGLSFFFGNTRKATISANNGAYIQVSDRNLKTNIASLGSVLERVNQLRPATYSYKADEIKKTTLGLIAQEVKPLFPELVSTSGKEKLLGLDYGAFSVVAIKAIQEQQMLIDQQSEKISDLEERLSKLEAIIGN